MARSVAPTRMTAVSRSRRKREPVMNALRLSWPIPDYKTVLRVIATFCIAIVAFAADNKAKPTSTLATSAQDDKAIEEAIRAKLAKSKIGKDGFTVRVQGGVAYW